MRRNEALALTWDDFDPVRKTLKITKALGPTKRGTTLKAPKTARGTREFDLGDDVVELLLRQKEKHLRIAAGIADDSAVDLGMIRLPEGALIFPQGFSLTEWRTPQDVSKMFGWHARKAGFAGFTLHMLRHSHATQLLDNVMPVHQVAARIGDDTAILLPVYAKLTKKKDRKMSDTINALGSIIIGS